MAINIGAGFGLAKGGWVYGKELKNGTWVSAPSVKDTSAPGQAPQATIAGGPNTTTYVQIDNDGKPGGSDTFWKIMQDARGNVVSTVKQAPLTVDARQGMMPGARVEIWSVDGKTRLYSAIDQSGADLDRTAAGKFSTPATMGADVQVRIFNPNGTTRTWTYRDVGAPTASRTEVKAAPVPGQNRTPDRVRGKIGEMVQLHGPGTLVEIWSIDGKTRIGTLHGRDTNYEASLKVGASYEIRVRNCSKFDYWHFQNVGTSQFRTYRSDLHAAPKN